MSARRRTLNDVNIVAPDYFQLPANHTLHDRGAFAERLVVFEQVMFSLDRAVLVTRDYADECALIVSSVEETPKTRAG